MSNTTVHAWMMTEQGKPVEQRDYEAPPPPPGEAIVEVAGCGVCHTDISFLYMGVPTRMPPPLVLGHEIAGTVVAVGEGVYPDLLDRPVLVPAVMPCGECPACQSDRRRICPKQIMPGNDRHGGFASHVTVPARYLCQVPDAVLEKTTLADLSIVADAVTTPFQAVKRAGLAAGDLAIVIGTGGLGVHAVQIAKAAGATVIAMDVDAAKLETAKGAGAAAVVDVTDKDIKAIKGEVKGAAKELGAPRVCWKIFETSGTKPGQETGFALLGQGATLAIVGFTMAKLEVRLSNLMAFDADMFGIWGCDPTLYPECLEWIGDGRIEVSEYAEQHPLADINEVLEASHHGKLQKRAVMVP